MTFFQFHLSTQHPDTCRRERIWETHRRRDVSVAAHRRSIRGCPFSYSLYDWWPKRQKRVKKKGNWKQIFSSLLFSSSFFCTLTMVVSSKKKSVTSQQHQPVAITQFVYIQAVHMTGWDDEAHTQTKHRSKGRRQMWAIVLSMGGSRFIIKQKNIRIR